jgi:hypothetical protein
MYSKNGRWFGVKEVAYCNKAYMLHHIWNLYVRAGSLWVAWVQAHLLKGKSFWQVKIPQVCSWSWRKLLKLRNLAKQFLLFKVGNGENIFLWLDSCHPDGILHDIYGYRVIYDAGSQLEGNVSSVLVDGCWRWLLVKIQNAWPMVDIGGVDFSTWNFSKKGVYNCAASWELIRHKQQIVEWWSLVWFSMAIPRQAFILWLAARDSLSTGIRLLSWGFGGNFLCVFWRGCIEYIYHLFFACSFCKRL